MATQVDEKAAKKAQQHTKYYNQDGKQVPGVTTITSVMDKPALKYWANNLGLQGIKIQEYVDDLAGAGTLAHAMIETHVNNEIHGIEEEIDTSAYSQDQIERAENSFLKYLEWDQGQDLEYVEAEKKVINEQWQYGGMADIVAYWNGVLSLLDIKTSRAIYEDMFTQLAGYYLALRDSDCFVSQATIVRVGRDENEGFEVQTCENLSLHTIRFQVCKKLYDLNKRIKNATQKR